MRPALRFFAAAAAACVVSGWQLGVVAPPAEASIAPGQLTAATGPSGVIAAAGELADVTTGKLLWTRNGNSERPMASITKVMTAVVVIDSGYLNRKITVTQAAVAYGQPYDASEAGLFAGDVLTARQLLEGLLLPSGADAAYMLATTYGPGWPAFVRRMNATARKLGMTRTHYANFDGLPWPTEYSTYSTATDLVKLATAAMKLAVFRQIVAQRSYSIAATSAHHYYHWTNTNLLLGSYRGAIGIKTGYTLGAGYCLLFAARRDRIELFGVVLGSTVTDPGMRFTAATLLLNWGFKTADPASAKPARSGHDVRRHRRLAASQPGDGG